MKYLKQERKGEKQTDREEERERETVCIFFLVVDLPVPSRTSQVASNNNNDNNNTKWS